MKQQTDLPSPTSQQTTENIPSLTVVSAESIESSLSSSKNGSPADTLPPVKTSDGRCEGESDNSENATGTSKRGTTLSSHVFLHEVPSSMRTTDRIPANASSQSRRSQQSPGLMISASSRGTAVQKHLAHTPQQQARIPGSRAQVGHPLVISPTAHSTVTTPSLRTPQDSDVKEQCSGDQMSLSYHDDGEEKMDGSGADAGTAHLLRGQSEVAEGGTAQRQPNNEAVNLEDVSCGVDRQTDAHDDAGAADGRRRSIHNHTPLMQSPPEDGVDSPAAREMCSATPPLNKGVPARCGSDDVADRSRSMFVAVRVRPRASSLALDTVSHSPELYRSSEFRRGMRVQPAQARYLANNSITGQMATMRRQPYLSPQASVQLPIKSEFGDSDGNMNTEEDSCIQVSLAGSSVSCTVGAPAKAPWGASMTETSVTSGSVVGQRTPARRFYFDHVFDDRATQVDIMETIGKPAVARVLEGYNGTVMCYGQSGSGKTHTIAGPHGGAISKKALRWLASQTGATERFEGDVDDDVDDDDDDDHDNEENLMHVADNIGLLPRMLHRLFLELEALHSGGGRHPEESAAVLKSSWQVTLSALELYNEDLCDLLPGDLRRREMPEKAATSPSVAAHGHHPRGAAPTATPAAKAAATLHDDGEGSPYKARKTAAVRPVRVLEEDIGLGEGRCGGDESEPEASRPTVKVQESDVATGSTIRQRRSQSCTSPSPSPSPVSVKISRSHRYRAQSRISAANGAPSTRKSDPAAGSVKTASLKWSAQTTALQGAVALRIRQEAAHHTTSPQSGRPSRRQSTRNAGSEAVYIEGLREHQVHDLQEAMEAVRLALKHRRLGSTALNKSSSRSHTFFFVRVEQREHRSLDEARIISSTRRSTLTIVDLAGSERVSHTGAHGLQLKEAQNINRSLSALGNVMRQLSSAAVGSLSNPMMPSSEHAAAPPTGPTADPYIPYRDNKLTHILQSNLGGNTITFLLCNVSPDPRDAQETMSTLRFAKFAKTVKNRVKPNESDSCTTDAQAAALALAKIQQLAGDVTAAQNRLRQLAAYTWWLEGHLGYFAAAMFQQQQSSGALATRAVIGANLSPSHSLVSGSVCDLLPEGHRSSRVMSNKKDVAPRNGGSEDPRNLEPPMTLERGVENREHLLAAEAQGNRSGPADAVTPASPEWWQLSPRPPNSAARADADEGAGDTAKGDNMHWNSDFAGALLSPTHPITQRRMELQRKLITAAAAAAANATVSVGTATETSTSSLRPTSGISLMALPYSVATLPTLCSADFAVGEEKSTTPAGVVEETDARHKLQSVSHGPLTGNSLVGRTLRSNAGGDNVKATDSTTYGGDSCVMSADPTTVAMGAGVPLGPDSQWEHQHPLPPPLLSPVTRQNQPPPESSTGNVPTVSSGPQSAPSVSEAQLVELEKTNLLLRLRLAELQRLLRGEGGGSNAYVTKGYRSTHGSPSTRRGVTQDFPEELSGRASSVATASAPPSVDSMPWPPHYSPVSADVSLEVFLARFGFAAMDPSGTSGADVTPPRRTLMNYQPRVLSPSLQVSQGTSPQQLTPIDERQGNAQRHRIAGQGAFTTLSPSGVEGAHRDSAALDRQIKTIDVPGSSSSTPPTHYTLVAPISSGKSYAGSDADCASSLTASVMSSAPPLWTPHSKRGDPLFTVLDYPPSFLTSARDFDETAKRARAAVHDRRGLQGDTSPHELGIASSDAEMFLASLSTDSLHEHPSSSAPGSREEQQGLLERIRTTFATVRAFRKKKDFSELKNGDVLSVGSLPTSTTADDVDGYE